MIQIIKFILVINIINQLFKSHKNNLYSFEFSRNVDKDNYDYNKNEKYKKYNNWQYKLYTYDIFNTDLKSQILNQLKKISKFHNDSKIHAIKIVLNQF